MTRGPDRRTRAVLLDVDGTLLDSNDAHAQAWVEAGRELGFAIEFERVRWLVGMGGDRVLPELTGLSPDSEQGARLLERRGEVFRERYLPHLQAFPGAAELLRRMRADGHRLVAATSASQADMHALLAQGGIAELIEDAANSDDAERSKPDPDIVQAALARSGEPPGHAVMLGDTPYDVQAATRAGVACIALTCGGWSADELKGAVEIYADPVQLLLRYRDSLLAR